MILRWDILRKINRKKGIYFIIIMNCPAKPPVSKDFIQGWGHIPPCEPMVNKVKLKLYHCKSG